MTPGEIVIIIVLLFWCFLSYVIVYGERIKRRYVHRLNDDWMSNGSSPWHVRAAWWILRPFVGGA